jgi:predicted nuclease of predicted toxin-antitoxin system
MVEALSTAGYDADWVGNWPGIPSDLEVLAAAASAGRVLITLDKDFGELAVAFGQPHTGIVRLVEVSLKAQAAVLRTALLRYGTELTQGAIVTASPGRIRIRMPQ